MVWYCVMYCGWLDLMIFDINLKFNLVFTFTTKGGSDTDTFLQVHTHLGKYTDA